MHPTTYDLNRPDERLRLLVEVRAYLRCCLREHHGTDFSGRVHAVDALDSWLTRLKSQIDALPLPELRHLIPPTTLADRLATCPECGGVPRVEPACSKCHGAGLVLPEAPPRPGIRYPIPPGVQPSRCHGCGALIYWVSTPNQKSMPIDLDGISHFSTCSKAGIFRRSR